VIGTTSQSPEILFPSGTPNAAPTLPPPPTLNEPPRTSGYAPLPNVPPSRVANVPAEPEIRLEKPEVSEVSQRTTLKLASASQTGLPAPVDVVAGHVATGRRPTLDDLDRLQSDGFRTFLDLSGTTANSNARRVFDARGMELRAVTASDVEIGTLVSKSASGSAAPVYVFADDSTALRNWWQRYFKETELVSDEAAKIRAARLIP